MSDQYPQYYQVEDPAGNPFALVAAESENLITVIQRRDVSNSFIITRLSNMGDVSAIAPGQMLGLHAIDFAKLIQVDWRVFNLSDAVMNAKVAAGVETPKKEEPNVLDNTAKPERVETEKPPADVSGTDSATDDDAPKPEPVDEQPADTNEPPPNGDGNPVSEPEGGSKAEADSGSDEGTGGDTGTGAEAKTAKPKPDTNADNADVSPNKTADAN